MLHCSNHLNILLLACKSYETRRFKPRTLRINIIYVTAWYDSACVLGNIFGILNDGSIAVNVHPSLMWFQLTKHLPCTFKILYLICSRNLDLYVRSFELLVINRYHRRNCFNDKLFPFSHRFHVFHISENEMTHDTIGLRRACSSPSSRPGDPPSLYDMYHPVQ